MVNIESHTFRVGIAFRSERLGSLAWHVWLAFMHVPSFRLASDVPGTTGVAIRDRGFCLFLGLGQRSGGGMLFILRGKPCFRGLLCLGFDFLFRGHLNGSHHTASLSASARKGPELL